MHAVDRRDLQIHAMSGYSFIGQEHEVLDKICGVCSLPEGDLHRSSHFIQYDLSFREVKIYTASLLPVRSKLSCKLLHIQKHSRQFLRSSLDPSVALPAQRLRDLAVVVLRKEAHHAVIGQARVHMDDRFRDLIF